MGFWGETTSENRASFVQGLEMNDEAGCRAADVDVKMGNIKIGDIKARGNCKLNMSVGDITMKDALTCESASAIAYTAKQLVKQKAKATGAGIQVSDIKASNTDDLENKVAERLKKSCKSLQGTVVIGDIDLVGIDCDENTNLDLHYATVGLDAHTNCLFEAASKIAMSQDSKQDAEAKQDLSFLAMIVAVLALILFSPEILAMSGAGALASSPAYLVLMALGVLYLLMEADCYLPWPLGGHVCKNDADKAKYRSRFKKYALAALTLLALSNASTNKSWLAVAGACAYAYIGLKKPPKEPEEEEDKNDK